MKMEEKVKVKKYEAGELRLASSIPELYGPDTYLRKDESVSVYESIRRLRRQCGEMLKL